MKWRGVYFGKKFDGWTEWKRRAVKQETCALECFCAAEKWAVLPRSIYYDTASLKTMVEKRSAHHASITMQCAMAYLDSLVFTPSAQTDDLVSLISQKCLDFELGDSAGVFSPHLLLVMSIALGFSGVFQTAAVRTDSCKLLRITSRGRGGRWSWLHRREAR